MSARAERPDGQSEILSRGEEIALQHEIMFQAWTVELAWKNLLVALEPPPILRETLRAQRGSTSREPMSSPVVQALLQWQVQVWSLVRVMLSAASVISRILWPLTRREPKNARERHAVERAAELRRRCGLDADSYLSNRDARDVFEHVEEKLVQWLVEHQGQAVQGLAIGSVAETPSLREQCFRLLDPLTKKVYAGAKECDLPKLFSALEDVDKHLPPMVNRIDFNLPADRA